MNTRQTVILIIDDQATIRQSMADYLEDMDYRILTAENGRIGLALFDQEKVDLVLVDLRMPEVSGLEVLSQITAKSPDTPLIVVSGTGAIADAIEALRHGAWDYLLKPIQDFSVLIHAVENALEKARLKRENRQYQQHLEQIVAERTKELQQANKRLSESERQFRSILDNIRAGIVIVETGKNEVVYVNPTAAEMIGETAEAIVGRRCYDLVCTAVEGRCPVLDLGQEVDSVEQMLKTSDGRLIPTLKTITRTNYQGKDCLLESFVDLTAQKQATAEKEMLATQLRQAQKMEALGTLAGGIAHDFNNILSAIIGYTELCFLDLNDPSNPLYQKLNAILHAGNRASELVAQILTFSHMKEQLLTPIDIAPIIEEALKLLHASLPANIELKNGIESKKIVLADPTQIHQIVMNLCTNAYHAMEEQGGVLSVSLAPILIEEPTPVPHVDLASGQYLQLTVEDTGTGISPSVLDNIFDPYFSTKDKDKGTGLGLAVVHGIVKAHAGAISVDSRIDEGTAVRVFLPTTEDAIDVKCGQQAILPRGTEKILLVDDEKDIVDIGFQMLGSLGYDVTCAVGSLEALETFKQSPQRFDLVVTDLNMPVMAGDRLAQALTRIRPNLPVILCTGFSDPLDRKRARSIGIRRIVMKPLAMNILAESVREVLDAS